MKTDAKITDQVERTLIGRQDVAREALLLIPELETILESFTGQVFKQDGSRTKRFNVALGEFLNSGQHSLYLRRYASGDVALEVKQWHVFGKSYLNSGEYSHDDGEYYELDFYVFTVETGHVDQLTIEDAIKKAELELVHRIGPIQETLKQIERAKKDLDDLTYSIPFWARNR